MAISFITAALSGTTGTTSFTITTPSASIEVGDLLILEFTHRGTGDGTVSDDSGDGVSWTRKGETVFDTTGTGTWSGQQYYKRATAELASADRTLTVSGLSNSSCGAILIYRGAVASGDPFEVWTVTDNIASGTESVAEITTLTDGAWVGLQISCSPSPASVTFTSPLIERVDRISTGGADCGLGNGSFEKASAGGSGTLAWNWSVNRATGAIAYSIAPASTTKQGAVASPFTVTPVIQSIVGAKAAVVFPATFAAVTNSVLTVIGRVSMDTSAGMVTSGDIPARGLVSWASFATPAVATIVEGQVDTIETFAAVVDGVTKRYGLVDSPFTITPVVRAIVDAKAAVATPITVETVTNGVRTVYGSASLGLELVSVIEGTAQGGRVEFVGTFATVVSGLATHYGAVVSPFTLTETTQARLDAKSATSSDFTLSTTTDGVRKGYAATSLPITFDTVTDGDVLSYGVVSWAAFVTPTTAAVNGAVTVDLTGSITTSGRRTAFGTVDDQETFSIVTNGTIAGGGQVSAVETIEIVTAARVVARSAIDLPETLSVATRGTVTVRAAASLQVTADTVTNSRRTVYAAVVVPETFEIVTAAAAAGAGAISLPITIGISSSGRVGARAAASLAVTAGIVTNSLRTVLATVVSPFAFAITTAQRAVLVGRVALPATLNIITGQRVTERASASVPISFNVATRGTQAGFVTAVVSLQITQTAATAGLAKRFGAVVYPTTLSITGSARVSANSSASLSIGANVQTNGIRTRYGTTSLPIEIGLETRGTKAGNVTGRLSLDMVAAVTTTPWLLARAQVGLPVALTTTTGAKQVAFAAIDMPIHLNMKSGNPIYSSGTNGHIAFGRTGTARRWTSGRIANARVRSIV